MAKFLGRVQGQRGEAHRLGHSSIDVIAASWNGAVRTHMYERDGVTRVRIETIPWQREGVYRLLFDGPLSVMQDGASPPDIIT